MKNLLLVLVLWLCTCTNTWAQYTLQATIKDIKTKEYLTGAAALVLHTNAGASADLNGLLTITNIEAGEQTIRFSLIGYTTQTITLNFPLPGNALIIYLEPNSEELEEIIVSSTRSSRNIDDVPTRIEAIGIEEIEEKSNMRPNNVSMILHESTGIQVQQTSATSANQSIRIQGLDGKYTQIVKDGFPAFGGFSGGLSLLEIPPLDLKQVEVIKGPASTLYGGGAVAGVVNFVSKLPQQKPENSIILNQTSAGGTDAGAFFSRKYKRLGFTFLANGSIQKPYDVNNDDFTEIPKSRSISILPKLFYYINDSTTLSIGNQATLQTRTGGDINVIKGNVDALHTYSEENKSNRNITFLTYDQQLKNNRRFTFKQSFSYFNRGIKLPDYNFGGKQYGIFTDASYLFLKENHTIITGLNFYYDRFIETSIINNNDRSEVQHTIGLYAQDTWEITKKWMLETGLRIDNNNKYGSYLLPRLSALYKINEKTSSRLGVGAGYKTPTIFTEQTETQAYRDIMPVSGNAQSEQSIGGTYDINYKTAITGKLIFSINQMVFYTYINKPLVLQFNSLNNTYQFNNVNKPIVSRGAETNVKFIYNNFKLFIGYTFTDAEGRYQQGNIHLPLVPGNKVNIALLYEKQNSLKIGLEAYYTDKQFLFDGSKSSAFWECGLMAEKIWKHYSIFVNFENFTDTRQSKFGSTVLGTHAKPIFPEIYTHTEGFVTNAGIKLKW